MRGVTCREMRPDAAAAEFVTAGTGLVGAVAVEVSCCDHDKLGSGSEATSAL
jgi:hypothetical protein